MQKKIDEVVEALSNANPPDTYIEQAKEIALIAINDFNGQLLDRALDIAKAVASFAHELEVQWHIKVEEE